MKAGAPVCFIISVSTFKVSFVAIFVCIRLCEAGSTSAESYLGLNWPVRELQCPVYYNY